MRNYWVSRSHTPLPPNSMPLGVYFLYISYISLVYLVVYSLEKEKVIIVNEISTRKSSCWEKKDKYSRPVSKSV